MPRDPEATRAALLAAATSEFAAHGIAGARVDRIGAVAGVNKALIYVHYGSKEGLFNAAFSRAIAEVIDAAPFTIDDLPGYVVAIHDFYRGHPDLVRLLHWHALERPGELASLPTPAAATTAKLAALREAQAAGKVDARLPAEELLDLLVAIADTWTHSVTASPTGVETRRATLRHAAHSLVDPQGPGRHQLSRY